MADDQVNNEIARLSSYSAPPHISRIHQKIGSVDIIKEGDSVTVTDNGLNDVISAPSNPEAEMQEKPQNFLGEFGVNALVRKPR